MTKEERKAYQKAYRQAHKEQRKASMKAWIEAHREEWNAYQKAYYSAHKEEHNKKCKDYYEAHKEKCYAYKNEYIKSDLNLLGQTKDSIRQKSRRILKKMNLHIDGYETHHCFGYEDASKFIYISRDLHKKIHQYLRDNNINADSDHWMAIRDLVNSADEFMYIKC